MLFLGGSGFLGRSLIGHFARGGAAIHATARSEASAAKIRAAAPSAVIVAEEDISAERYQRVFNLIVDYGRG